MQCMKVHDYSTVCSGVIIDLNHRLKTRPSAATWTGSGPFFTRADKEQGYACSRMPVGRLRLWGSEPGCGSQHPTPVAQGVEQVNL